MPGGLSADATELNAKRTNNSSGRRHWVRAMCVCRGAGVHDTPDFRPNILLFGNVGSVSSGAVMVMPTRVAVW